MAPGNRNKPKRASGSDATYTIMDFTRDFPDDAACLDWLWRHLYSHDGLHAMCPKCERKRKFHRVASRPSYSCDSCGHHIHPTAGTIFHKSSTSLQLWFHAIYLVSSTRCGISAKQLEREIGVTYKCAWRMFNRIRRLLLADASNANPLSGDVEMDETYMGGRPRLSDGIKSKADAARWRAKSKTPVFGMVERGGRIHAKVVSSKQEAALGPIAGKHVLPESVIYTDEAATYDVIGRRFQSHHRIRHRAKVYVEGDVHTQTIEGFFSLLKNGIRGVYHSVSEKHLQSYVDEYVFRYNHRKDRKPIFTTLLENVRAEASGDPLASGSPS